MNARSWLKCIPKDPQIASFPPHVLLHFHPSTRFISLCKGVHTILYTSNHSFPFHGIPCHASQSPHTLFSFIFLIWDTICTIHPYSPKFRLFYFPYVLHLFPRLQFIHTYSFTCGEHCLYVSRLSVHSSFRYFHFSILVHCSIGQWYKGW